MKLSKIALGFMALLSANTFAASITIENADFDAQASSDNDIQFSIQGWMPESGVTGIYNPPDTVFTGEAGDGSHKNTLFLFQEAKISQTLSATLEANTEYTLGFDVGERSDYSIPNYIVTVKADDEVLLRSYNPVFPSQAGTFSTASLTFSSEDVEGVGSNIVLEIETYGSGQANFDNFTLTSTASSSGSGSPGNLGYTVVAYGREVAGSSSYTEIYTTQTSENALPYMVEDASGNISCNEGSIKVLVGLAIVSTVSYTSVQCVLSHQ